MADLRIRILGSVGAEVDGHRVSLGGRRQQAMLASLAVRLGHVVPVDVLIDDLWGDRPPQAARNSIQRFVSDIRRALGEAGDRLETVESGYRLRANAEDVDGLRFEALVRAAQATPRPGDAFELFQRALRLWSGRPFEGVNSEVVAAERVRLEELHAAAEDGRAQSLVDLGRDTEAVPELERMVSDAPLREQRWSLLMLALYRAGRQADALRAFQRARATLVDELGIDPSASLAGLEARILNQDPTLRAVPEPADAGAEGLQRQAGTLPEGFEALPTAHPQPFYGREELTERLARRLATPTVSCDHNLPVQRTSFVGRETEAEETVALLEQCRLVTLTGLGGTGKTRLALEVAARAGPDHETVRLVELASLEAPAGLPATVREALPWPGPVGRHDAVADLVAAIGDRRLLLVVDNCEHLLGDVARLVASCLDGCRNLTVLATSREPLHVEGEHVRVVRPLSLAKDGDRTLSPAVQLFMDRAAAVGTQLSLDDGTVEDVEHICRHLDGIPLAIELAAARARHLAPAELAARLDERLALLASRGRTTLDRHRTLSATLDWSYDLLTPEERAVFRRIACFAAPVALDAIEAVVSDPDLPKGNVLDVIAALVDRSLLVAELHERVTRYRLLETVRRYALTKLEEATELRRTQVAHARWSAGLVESAGSLARLTPGEQQDVIAALHWAVAERHELAVELARRSWQWWEITGRPDEGRRLLESILAFSDPSPSLERSAIVSGAAQLAFIAGELDVAASLHETNIRQVEPLGDPTLAARSRNSLAVVHLYQRNLDAAEQLATRSLEDFDRAHEMVGVAYARSTLGLVAASRHRVDAAVAQLLESLRLLRREGRKQDAASVLTNLGNVAQDHNDLARAHRFYEGALQLQADIDDDRGMAQSLNNLSIVAGQRGDVDHAWEFADRALAIFRAVGDRPGEAASLNNLANLAGEQGQHRRAIELYRSAVEHYRDLRDVRGTITSLANLADLALLCGEVKLAWRCAVESLALSVSFGKAAGGAEALGTLRSIGEVAGLAVVAELEAAIGAGDGLKVEKVLDLLRATDVPSSIATDSSEQPSQLTRREGQVAALVARGLANSEVAAELFISERTVDSHMSHIRAKLGIDSRTQLVRWAVDHGLR